MAHVHVSARQLAPLILAVTLSGCLSTAATIVTAPIRVAGKTTDMLTTSQSEADEKRGRDMRKHDERLGKLDSSYRKHQRDCENGNQASCTRAQEEYDEIQSLQGR